MQPIHIHPIAHRLPFMVEKSDKECKSVYDSLVPILEAKILFLSYLGDIWVQSLSSVPHPPQGSIIRHIQ